MISCNVVRDLLPLYADGLVSEDSERLIREHTAHCPACRRTMEEMCAPIEPEAVEEDRAYLDVIRAQKRKNRRRMVLACVLSVLFCLAGWLLYMETHFYAESPVIITTDGEKILSQMPELALTEAEKKLGDQLWKATVVQDALGSTEFVDLPLDMLQEFLPENTSHVSVYCNNVTIEYTHNEMRAFLEYLGGDNSDEVSAIRKTIAVPKSGQDVSVKAIYTLEYVFALDKTWYQKQASRHVWFSFLELM